MYYIVDYVFYTLSVPNFMSFRLLTMVTFGLVLSKNTVFLIGNNPNNQNVYNGVQIKSGLL